MKVVILAGGFGTRISEESHLRPKPMIEIGDRPILWHIMKSYSHYGFADFIICLGYKGYLIKEYFANYYLHQSNVTIDLKENSMQIHNSKAEPWKVTLIDTGIGTMTGGRLKRAEEYVGKETFMMTYGDGLADINIRTLLDFHKKHKKIATLTAIQNPGRFGVLDITDNDIVLNFLEKPKGEGSWINGGFFILEPQVFDYIKSGDATVWEREPLENLCHDKQLVAYKHTGSWACMDTLRDVNYLNGLWNENKAFWKVWK
jgi:glucose-1-phosphate cytidylyltransferase